MSTAPTAAPERGDGRRLRWAKHRIERRAAFVQAGVEAVDTIGLDASAEEIAERAGVSRTVLYRYFSGRDDLDQAIAESIIAAVIESVVPVLTLDTDTTPRTVIEGTVGVIFDWFEQHPNLYFFLRAQRSGPSLDSIESTLAAHIAVILKFMLAVFGVEPDEADPGAHGIVGLVEAMGAWWLGTRSMSRDQMAALASESVWYLLSGTAQRHDIAIGYDEPLPIPGAWLTSDEQSGTGQTQEAT